MKTQRILALLVALLMMASFAVAESTDDPVVVKAGDQEILLSEAQETYDYWLNQYEQLYVQNGMVFSDYEGLRDAVVETLVQKAVLYGKVAELGLGDVTEEEKTALRAEVEAEFEEQLAAYAAQIGLSVEETRETVAAEGITVDTLYESALEELPVTRLREQITADVTVSDEDINAEYDAYVEEDKSLFESDVASYEMYVQYYGAGALYYTPEGFRYVKHILLETPADVAAEMIDFETDMGAIQTVLDGLYTELDALENVEAEPAEGEAAPRTAEAIQADIDAQEAKYNEAHDKYEEAREQILPSLQPTIDEIMTKLQDGASFDDLIAEYNTDPGMASSPDGYMVHKDSIMWETSFRDAAMALANVGDISDPLLSSYGVHIIEYTGDVPAGPVPITDEVAEGLRESLLTNVQDEAFTKAYEEWAAEVEISTNPELIVVPESATPLEDEADAPEDNADAPAEGDEPEEGADEGADE